MANTVAVIGAGPAGATAAYVLAKKGIPVHLYEASPHVGGMARSIQMWGQTVDIGPHRFFSADPRVNKLWLEVIGDDYSMVDRLTRIFFCGKAYHYPLKMGNALRNLGLVEATRCLASYVRQQLTPRSAGSEDTFEGWVTARFGKRLYQHFFKTYTEKLWGIPADQLDSDFARQRIKRLSLWEAVRDAILGGGSERHRTLVDQFAYPNQGTGEVYRRMCAFVADNGGQVYLNTPIHSLVTSGNTVTGIRLPTGEVRSYDQVISSMPLTALVGRLTHVPPEVTQINRGLKFRNTLLVYLRVKGSDLFPDNWIYVHSPELLTGRITNFDNWVPSIKNGMPDTILAMEYWCFDEDDIWRWPERRCVALATSELIRTGLVPADHILDGAVIKVPRCYPVYRLGYRTQLAVVEDFLRGYQGLQVIGRGGAFKYNNQDHSILMGLLAAENIADGANHDLWSVNSDDEYQESSTITETGLVTVNTKVHSPRDR